MSSALKLPVRMLASAGVALTLLFSAACDDDDDPVAPVATELEISAGNNQTIAPNTASAPLSVILRDQNDEPLAGRTVNWAVATGSGTLSGATSITDQQGVATITFTSDATAGAATVTASVPGVTPVTFSLMVQ